MAAAAVAGGRQQQQQGEEGKRSSDAADRKRKDPPSRAETTAAAEEEQQQQEQKRRTKPKKAFIYGNYKSYYSYRIERNVNEDPRLAVFKGEWFEGKDCLDIGCNEGLITISIAKKFFCQSILGIDIDAVHGSSSVKIVQKELEATPFMCVGLDSFMAEFHAMRHIAQIIFIIMFYLAGLVETAYWNLRKIAKVERGNCRSMGTSRIQNSKCVNPLETNVDPASNGKTSNSQASLVAEELFKRVSFLRENFVENLRGCSEKYDTVLCLSVTKWVHLNWGDDGLINLFVKIWRLLRPGGILLLESQPWSSYKKNYCVSETAKANYNSIHFRPDKFREILLDKVGFRSAELITDSLSGTVVGFDRPIVMFCK